MKHYIIILLTMCLQISQALAQEDAISKFFGKYMDDQRFTSVYISGKMFSMFAKIPVEEDEKALKEAVSNLSGLRILTSDSVNGRMLYNDAAKNLSLQGYEELMFIKEGGQEEMQFLVKEDEKGIIKELLMLMGGRNNFFLMSIIGNIDLEQLAKLSKSMDIKGLENLEKLNDKKE